MPEQNQPESDATTRNSPSTTPQNTPANAANENRTERIRRSFNFTDVASNLAVGIAVGITVAFFAAVLGTTAALVDFFFNDYVTEIKNEAEKSRAEADLWRKRTIELSGELPIQARYGIGFDSLRLIQAKVDETYPVQSPWFCGNQRCYGATFRIDPVARELKGQVTFAQRPPRKALQGFFTIRIDDPCTAVFVSNTTELLVAIDRVDLGFVTVGFADRIARTDSPVAGKRFVGERCPPPRDEAATQPLKDAPTR